SCCKRYGIQMIVLALVIAGVTIALVFGLKKDTSDHIVGAVASNGEECAEIGGQMLKDGGSAIDAAIATLLCEGVILPHSLGIGGGFVATIYTKETRKIESIIARETAPAAAHRDMFIGKEITGAISAAIPSEVFGFWQLHKKYGKLQWKQLFKPAIDLSIKGHKVSKYLANVLALNSERIWKEPSMAEIFINPSTNNLYREGEIMYRPQLGKTLRILADEGPEAIVRWEAPIVARFTGGYELYTTPLPTSGAILAFILNVMEPLYTRHHDIYWQRVVETFKHAYGHRTNLGDIHFEPQVAKVYDQLKSPAFADEIRELIKDDHTFIDMAYYGANFTNVEDHGTANLVVLAPNGDAISITSTINSHLGAKVRSRQTGIILNDEMDDFSTPDKVNAYGIPASPANYIKPGKRPMSSTCPSIVLDKHGNVQLLIGGAGGSRITTSVAQTILRYFVFGESIESSVNSGRIHHQLAPMVVDVEPEVPDHTEDYLTKVGHDINYLPYNKAYSALTAIGLKSNWPHPICDRRRVGSAVVIHPNK
ncbi:hypothetical protein DOY81_008927, partial [Sarcophaga bullata]